MEDITIHLLKGFGRLNFGDTVKQALTYFGEPDEKEDLVDELLQEKSLVYHYWDRGFSLFFKYESGGFHCAEVDNKNAMMLDEKIFTLKESEIIQLFRKNAFPVTETEQHPWGEKRISFDEAFTDLYFERGKLVSINFCAPEILEGFNKARLN